MQRLHSWLFQITARPTRNLCAWNSAKSECISKFLSPKAPRLKYGKRRCLDSVRNYEGYLRDLERCSPTRYGVSDYFFIPLPAVKLWSFGPWNKIRTDPLWLGNGLQSLFKSRPVSIPVWCIAWLKILSSAITHICSLCQINRQLIRKRNNSKWASASWTTVSPYLSLGAGSDFW